MDLENLSAMSVNRFFKSDEKRKMEDDLELGRDPVRALNEQTREEMRGIHEECIELKNKCFLILNDLEKGTDDALKLKAVKESRESLGQLMKNMISIRETHERKVNTAQTINLKKEVHIKNLLLNVSQNLCPKCRKEMSRLLEEM